MAEIRKILSNSKIGNSRYLSTEAIAGSVANPFAKRKAATMRMVKKLINEHLPTLSFKYRQAIKHSDYGDQNLDTEKWNSSRKDFIDSVLLSRVNSNVLNFYLSEVQLLIDRTASSAQQRQNRQLKEMSPYEYEDHCAELLRAAGWTAKSTKRSGDQGIDVIAKKGRLSVAIQCKLYTGKVGNDAVQEALSGREFARTDYGAVVTSSTYTKSAMQLAASTGIFLLNTEELKELEARLISIQTTN